MANKKFETLDGFNSQGEVTIAANLAVDTDVLYVDTVNDRVGIGKTNPSTDLDVSGTVTATSFSGSFSGDGSSVTSVNAATVGSLSAGQFLRSDTGDTFTGGALLLNGTGVTVANANLRLSNTVPLRFGSSDTPGVNMTFNPNELDVNGSNVNFDSGTLFVDTGNNRVGVGKTNPSSTLDVNGTVTATAFSGDGSGLSGISTDYINGASFNTGNGILSLTGVGSAGASVDLDGRYVDLTNTQTIGGDKTFTSETSFSDGIAVLANVRGSGTGAARGIRITSSIKGDSIRFLPREAGVNGHDASFTPTTLTASRTYTLPNASGTVALTSDIPAPNNGTLTLNTSGIATGSATFTADQSSGSTFTVNVPATNLSYSTTTTSGTVSSSTGTNATILDATASRAGLVTTSTQTFGGIKTAPDFVASSDEKLKTDIEALDIDTCLDTVLSLRPTSYRWKENGEYDTGLIAQEVQQVLEHRVHESNEGTLAVSYAKLVTELIGAVQSQNKTISLLKEEIEELKGKL